MKPMKPLRATMIRQRQRARLAPRTQDAYAEAVAGLAKFSWCSPDRLNPEQMRDDLHHLLVERQLAWSSWNQIACGLKFFSLKTLGWDMLHLNVPPRKGRSQLPQVLSLEELERLFMRPTNPKHRALLMTTYAAGLRVSEVTRLQCSDIERDRMLIRIEQGKGRKDRYTILSDHLLAELRAYWKIDRPRPWLFPGHDLCTPMSISAAQRITYRAKQGAHIPHGKGLHTLRHCFATHLLEAGTDIAIIQARMGHRWIGTTMMDVRISRRHLKNVRSPFDLIPLGALPATLLA